MDTFGLHNKQGDTSGSDALPEPTACRPGSAGKVAELRRRWDAGLLLWHPNDNGHVHYRFNSTNRRRRIDYSAIQEAATLLRRLAQARHKASRLLIGLLR